MVQISSGLLHMKISFTFIYYVKSLHKGFYFWGYLCCNMKATKTTPSETTALSLMFAYLLDIKSVQGKKAQCCLTVLRVHSRDIHGTSHETISGFTSCPAYHALSYLLSRGFCFIGITVKPKTHMLKRRIKQKCPTRATKE